MAESLSGSAIKALAAGLTVSAIGLSQIALNEDGKAATAPIVADYKDIGGVVTACGGIVKRGFTPGTKRTRKECDIMLREVVTKEEKTVQRLVTIPVTQGQFDWLVDIVHNAGAGAFGRAAWLPVLNAGECKRAGAMILTWRATVNGKPNKGVANRRKKQSDGWLAGC